jgi:hypothetical protein
MEMASRSHRNQTASARRKPRADAPELHAAKTQTAKSDPGPGSSRLSKLITSGTVQISQEPAPWAHHLRQRHTTRAIAYEQTSTRCSASAVLAVSDPSPISVAIPEANASQMPKAQTRINLDRCLPTQGLSAAEARKLSKEVKSAARRNAMGTSGSGRG